MTVTALDGTHWEVTRRADGHSLPAAIAFLTLTIAAWVVALVLVLPAALFLPELALVLLLLSPRAYVVAARNPTTDEVRSERIRGRRRSRRAEHELARRLSRGV